MLGRVKRGAFELHLEGLTSFGGRKPRAVVATVAPDAGAARRAGRARTADAAHRARAGRPQIHAARHAGAVARFLQPRCRGISRGARAVPHRDRSRSRASCCSRRATRSAAGPMWSRRAIRSRSEPSRRPEQRATARRASRSRCRGCRPSTSRISDSGVERGGSTSPTTLPKSNVRSASNLRASCCMRRLSARQCMCSDLMPRLRAREQRALEQYGADAVALPGLLDAEGGFRLARERRADRAQLGGAAQHAVDKEAVHHDADVARRWPAWRAMNSSDTAPEKRRCRLSRSSRSRWSR